MIEIGELDSGYGVLLRDLLVIDIDPRNGGKRLPELEAAAGMVVETGSGGWHYYFASPGKPVNKKHEAYPGVDFLSGERFFVVGPGSMHKSGKAYRLLSGSPDNLPQAPSAIIGQIVKSELRVESDRGQIDISLTDLADATQHIPDFDDYETWVRIGMALHNATNGSDDGRNIWDKWSARSDKYKAGEIVKKWRSFGEAVNPVTVASIIHLAQGNGWVPGVEFDSAPYLMEDVPAPTVEAPEQPGSTRLPFAVNDLSMSKPPGFVGVIADWIDSQCLYPRRALAVAAAISTIGDIAGLRAILDDGLTKPNTLIFAVAGSGTGKEAVIQARIKLYKAAGIIAAHHGAIKSEQEIIRNVTRQAQSVYTIDEVGHMLKKIDNAQKRGGATYLEGIIGIVMSIYSKSNGLLPVSGDLRKEVQEEIKRGIKAVEARHKEHRISDDECDELLAKLEKRAQIATQGINKPYLSVMGFTTPGTFDDTINDDNMKNGFLARALIVEEAETNPKPRPDFMPSDLPAHIERTLLMLHRDDTSGTDYDVVEEVPETVIPSTDEAKQFIRAIMEYQWQIAEAEKSNGGYEAVWRRLTEQVNKVSLCLAIPEGLRTGQHVRWAFEYCRRNIMKKIALAVSQEGLANSDAEGAKLEAKIASILDGDNEEKEGTLINRCRKFKKRDVQAALERLVTAGALVKIEHSSKANGRSYCTFKRRGV
jgi:hypothetical protein